MNDTRDHASKERILSVLDTIRDLNRLNDVDSILDGILFEARRISHADAGTIFLRENDLLKFAYVQNDTLFRQDETVVELYSDRSVPIDENSIVGYVGLTQQPLSIDDAYNLPDNLPFEFNPDYDRKSGYRTTSILTIPVKGLGGELLGVLQLINHKDPAGAFTPFTRDSQTYVQLFADHASVAIERGMMNRELVLRMMKLAELKDPNETGAHVQRVGAYSAEIYQRWAKRRGLDRKTIKHNRDLIRLASMLHDVGKVGITDFIIKKPGKLTDEEYNVMKWHTVYGARVFVNRRSDLDRMSSDIALNHHERWEGDGYPGKIPDILSETIRMGPPKKATEIPLPARITALADVFDALASKRSYKDPWTDEKILSVIEESSGTHFDPELVAVFFEIFDVIKAIRDRFR
jgi:HD-GYP domain-containing protein (c-di-GMP phosphodiesterase class II)